MVRIADAEVEGRKLLMPHPSSPPRRGLKLYGLAEISDCPIILTFLEMGMSAAFKGLRVLGVELDNPIKICNRQSILTVTHIGLTTR